VTSFDVASSSVIRTRAEYTDYLATDYLTNQITLAGGLVPRLPIDAGSVAFSGDHSLILQGAVYGRGATGGRGAAIDISTSENIFIGGPAGSAPAGSVYLNAALLNSFSAESLLIGGLRQTTSTGVTITVNTPNIEVNNAGSPLIGQEIMLVANQTLTLDPGAEIVQRGFLPSTGDFKPTVNIGSSTIPGSGDGVFLRVSAREVPLVRSGFDSSNVPNLVVGAGAIISGSNVTLDSTGGATLSPSAVLGKLAPSSVQQSRQIPSPPSPQTAIGKRCALG